MERRKPADLSALINEQSSLTECLTKSQQTLTAGRREEIVTQLNRLNREIPILQRLKKITAELDQALEIAQNNEEPQLASLAEEEAQTLKQEKNRLEQELANISRADKDPRHQRNVIMEIRAGTGGMEATLFARDLFRMYSRFAEKKSFSLEIFDSQLSEKNGFKSVVFMVKGRNAYAALQYESGVHRVQRIPDTESSGRIHTSAATVAVFPEIKPGEVAVKKEDLKIDTFCASGHGGQSVNTTHSAVRITHLPTGLVVSCQDERSQFQNKERALKILGARLAEQERALQEKELSAQRKQKIRSGDRSEKIRTYNFPQNRLSDHRINFTSKNLKEIMDGNLEPVIKALQKEDATDGQE